MNEKICVVIPVYNVEKYVGKCIKSVVNQTYKNLEIIIVNDGSTDNSLEICNDLSKYDERIKVVSKKNGGLSDARNYGMKYCNCKLITFIDSDDYVSEKYIENLYTLMTTNNVDIACTNYINCYEDGKVDEFTNKKINLKLNSHDAIKNVLYQKEIANSAWGKLYKFELFKKIKFPKGKLCEDLGTFYKLFEKSEFIAYDSIQDYFYLQRNSSIMGSKFNEKKLDGLNFAIDINNYYREKNIIELINASNYRISAECLFLLRKIPSEEKNIKKIVKNILKNKLFNVLIDENVSFLLKIKLILILFL